MVKVIIEQTLEFDEDFLLEMINNDKEWDDLEKFEDIPLTELEEWISESEELIREEMYESDYVIKQVITESDDNN